LLGLQRKQKSQTLLGSILLIIVRDINKLNTKQEKETTPTSTEAEETTAATLPSSSTATTTSSSSPPPTSSSSPPPTSSSSPPPTTSSSPPPTTSSSPPPTPLDAIPHYKQILIPHDGSKLSDKALGHAIFLSKVSDAEIVILNVLERLEGNIPSSVSATLKEEDEGPGVKGLDKGDRDLEITMEGGVKKMIEDRINLCKEAGVKSQISYKLQTGKPVDEIVKLCKEMDIDLIVMASNRITSPFAVMGSTTRKVIDNAKKPVLVIHE
jgi:nucleotide-binding universal stress UspA family protein